ncbi:DNA-protecting protein DprA [uncultured Dubosiella sp.]|uniref:DNA-protecting protein DprA n=1 Tax=uncultured Dubosiella sp. TaxID=1937011 RepID=UPI0025A68E18|nr:DNA-protecting protein DprA [uncultured Dubosiella sp.]
MEKKDVERALEEVYTGKEAAEFLNISVQRLNQLVHAGRLLPVKSTKGITLFYKGDLEERKFFDSVCEKKEDHFEIDIPRIRDAILYFTIQQYFNNNDKKTEKFINEWIENNGFDYRAGLKININFLASQLQVSAQDFYREYQRVKESFKSLSRETVLLKRGEQEYPALLENTKESPLYLFCIGNLELLNEKSVCVVGSRNASKEAMEKTERLVGSLVKRNIVISAGLARGIDTASHRSALENNGKTIAVIGTPINQYYPKENRELQKQIEEKGLVVSQFPPCNKVNRWNFPTRNGVMSGISIATVIMEAGETSGALKQADYALKQNKQVLIPQKVIENTMLKWPKKYLGRGAHSFSSLKNVLELLNQNQWIPELFKEEDLEEMSYVEMDNPT